MAAPSFPNYTPSKRDFRQGTFPTRQYKGLSGAITYVTFGNKASGYELRLEYAALNTATTEEIMQHYMDTKGGVEDFAVPDNIWQGLGSGIRDLMQAPNGIRWSYGEAPQVESVLRDRQNVRVTLIGNLIAK